MEDCTGMTEVQPKISIIVMISKRVRVCNSQEVVFYGARNINTMAVASVSRRYTKILRVPTYFYKEYHGFFLVIHGIPDALKAGTH